MVGELIAGRYELQELVGSGGMSNVFRAYDRLLERQVAIKILHEQFGQDDDYVERFRREARSVAQLAHPNIVTVIDRGEEDGRQYIVFEYVEGDNLKALVADGALPIDEAVRLGLQVARALDFAHTRGLVHRDVKPQNVLLNDEGQAKVTDFGIARSLDVHGVTQTGTVLGTSDYIAPEQARGEQVDQKTDVYSLGTVLFELLTGEVPYKGDNFVTVAMQHVNEPVPSLLERRPDAPLRLANVVESAMAKDPMERPGMDELVAELEACLAGQDGSEEGATMIVKRGRRPRASRPRKPRRSIPIFPVLLALLAVGTLAGGAYVLVDGTPDVPVVAEEEPSGPVGLTGVAAYDPEGRDGEHGADAPDATDGDEASYWPTEQYDNFTKSGVGLVVLLERDAALSRLTVRTETPGFEAKIRAGNSQRGPFADVSGDWQEVTSEQTTFAIDTNGREYSHYLIWLRLPREGGNARINEVTART